MKGTNHEQSNYISGTVFLFLALRFNVPHIIIFYILFGLCILSLVLSPDLDHEKSRPTQRWGPLKGMWEIFVVSGHREVLHHWFWGTEILCTIPAVVLLPYIWHTQGFSVLWMLVGLTVSIWLHIITDKISAIKNIPKRIKRQLVKTWTKPFM
jgi:uncharacterized metal-binding protein